MNYRNDWLSACFGSSAGASMIDVKFKHHADTDIFSRSMLQILSEDPAVEYITDADTGEILFSRE